MITRSEKKALDYDNDLDKYLDWLMDFRGAMMEAIGENSDLRVIVRQFKRRMTKHGTRNRYYKRNRLNHVVKFAIDNDRIKFNWVTTE